MRLSEEGLKSAEVIQQALGKENKTEDQEYDSDI